MTPAIEEALAILGLRPGASLKDCHQSWHQLTKQCHPDTQVLGSQEHEQALKKQCQLNAAYELLKKSGLDNFPKPEYENGSAEMPAVPADDYYQSGRRAEDGGDVLTAMRIYEGLAYMGHAKSQFRLGYLYSESVMKDIKLTLYWWKRAADQGHVLAQYNLGLMCERGLGMPVDLQKASEWFAAAARQGDVKAKAKLNALSQPALKESAGQAHAVPESAAAGQSMCGPKSETAGRAFISRKNRAS
jgi:TPR repeat protein